MSNTYMFLGLGLIHNMNHETYGERVKRLRLALGITQSELGKRCGMRQSAIGNIESGQRTGSRNGAKLAAALGVTAMYLETGKGDPSARFSPEAVEIAKLFDTLPDDARARLRAIVMAAVGPIATPGEVTPTVRLVKITQKSA